MEALEKGIHVTIQKTMEDGGSWLSCHPARGDEAIQSGHEILNAFHPRAWRRPVTEEEQLWISAAFETSQYVPSPYMGVPHNRMLVTVCQARSSGGWTTVHTQMGWNEYLVFGCSPDGSFMMLLYLLSSLSQTSEWWQNEKANPYPVSQEAEGGEEVGGDEEAGFFGLITEEDGSYIGENAVEAAGYTWFIEITAEEVSLFAMHVCRPHHV